MADRPARVVRRDRNAEAGARVGDTLQFVDAPDVLHVGHHHVVGASFAVGPHRIPAYALLESGLAYAQRRALAAESGESGDVPVHLGQRAFDPVNAPLRRGLVEPHRRGLVETPMTVDHEARIGSDGLAHRGDA